MVLDTLIEDSVEEDKRTKFGSSINTLRHGFEIQKKQLYPIHHHCTKSPIFKKKKVEELFLSGINPINEFYSLEIKGSDQKSFGKDYETKMSFDSEIKFFCAPAVKAEFQAAHKKSGGLSKLRSNVHEQHRTRIAMRRVEMLTSHFSDRNEMNEWFEPKPLLQLLDIDSPETADKFLSEYGLFYIHQVDLGGLSISELSESMSAQAEVEVDENTVAGGAGGIIQNVGTVGNKANISKYTRNRHGTANQSKEGKFHRIGGDAKNTGDIDAWKGTITEENMDICECKFSPMYFLLPEDDDVRYLLQYAHFKRIVGYHIQPDLQYSIKSEFAKKQNNLDYKEMDNVTFMEAGGNFTSETDNEIGTLYCVKDEGENFLRRRKNHHIQNGVKISEGKNVVNYNEKRCQWRLEEFGNGDDQKIIIWSPDEEYMLGVTVIGRLGDCKLQLVLKKKSKKPDKKVADNYTWNLSLHSTGNTNFKEEAERLQKIVQDYRLPKAEQDKY